jgi:hypothetical protein
MNHQQQIAFDNPCLLAEETADPKFGIRLPNGASIVLTVNTGYE